MANFLHKNYPGFTYYCVYEAGFCGFWIQRSLESLGINCIVTHPADIPTTDKERKRKNDRIDSRKLARGLRSNMLTPIYVPSVHQEEDRALLRTRNRIVRDQTRAKNRIKSFLRIHNIELQGNNYKCWSKAYIERLKQVKLPNSYAQCALDNYINEYLNLNKQEKQLYKKIVALSNEPRYKNDRILLQTIPSMGLLSAMIILTEIGDINRFETRNHLYSYFGMTPNVYSSSDKENCWADH